MTGDTTTPSTSSTDAADAASLLEAAHLRGEEGHRRPGPAIERLLVCLLARGHCLLEGVPGLAKTLAVETLASVVGGTFARIQFTPDLVPADIVGTRIYRASTETFDVELGPVFANFVLADEINRAPAKVQSALLEVMAEHHVSIGGKTYPRARSVPGAGHAEPDRVRGRLPAPRGAARPVPDEGRRRLPHARRGGRDRPPHGRRPAHGAADASRPSRLLEAAARRPTRSTSTTASSTTRCASCSPPASPPQHGLPDLDRAHRLRRQPPRQPRARRRRPGARAAARPQVRRCPRTCSTWRPTSCATGWCSPTRRSPTASRSTTSSPGSCRRSRRRASAAAARTRRPRPATGWMARRLARPAVGRQAPAPARARCCAASS